jgi:hypothetical protein
MAVRISRSASSWDWGDRIRPGKMALLESIRSNGPIRGAAKSTGMRAVGRGFLVDVPIKPFTNHTKTGVSRCRVASSRLPAVRSARPAFPQLHRNASRPIAILPVIGSVEIFWRLGLSAAAKEPPRVHAVATLLPGE